MMAITQPSIGLFEAMRSQLSIKRFRPDRVARELIEQILTAATWAPNGSNRQPWEFIVVEDADTKLALADIYRKGWYLLGEQASTRRRFSDPRTAQKLMLAKSLELTEHLEEAPVLIVVCMNTAKNTTTTDGALRMFWEEGNYTSILPAVQNLMLAARGLGLGTCLTTALNIFAERAKDVLLLPDEMKIIALIPVGYPQEDFRPVKRIPASEFTHWGTWQSGGDSATADR